MKLTIKYTSRFKKDYKLAQKRGKNLPALLSVIERLSRGEVLESKYSDHLLTGDYAGFRECHIEPDWLLVYCINDDALILTCARTGTHSDLF